MARNFNGTTQYLDHAAAVKSAEPVSFSAWINPTTNGTDDVVGIFNTAGAGRLTLGTFTSGLDIGCRASTGGAGVSADTSNVVSPNSGWHHIAATFASTTQRISFLDGDLGNAGLNTAGSSAASLNNTAIGVSNISSQTRWFTGDIAEVAIWSVALDSNEIVALSKGFSPLRIRRGNLLLYTPLLGQSPEPDFTANNRAMTLNNSPTYASHAPVMPWFSFDDMQMPYITAVVAGHGLLLGGKRNYGIRA